MVRVPVSKQLDLNLAHNTLIKMQNPQSPPVLLASSSRYRKELLERIIDDFNMGNPEIDEIQRPDEPPHDMVRRLARQKAGAFAGVRGNQIIIGADQIAILGDNIIGKPGDRATAISQLLAANGKTVQFLTSVCVLDLASHNRYEHTDVTNVVFRQFDRRLAEAYVNKDKPYDCAGSIKAESAGVILFRSIQSEDPTALLGLPLIWLAATLRDLQVITP